MSLVALVLAASVDPAAVPEIYWRGYRGHACPVSATVALTARHVVEVPDKSEYDLKVPEALAWNDNVGNRGVVEKASVELGADFLDLATLNGNWPFHWRVAERPVKEGDTVYTVWRELGKRDFPVRLSKGKVTAVGGWDFYALDLGGPGGSGSCVFNDSGEVVGVYYAGIVSGGVKIGVSMRVDVKD